MSLRPGVIFIKNAADTSKDTFMGGAFLDLDAPKLGFHLQQKSHVGVKSDYNLGISTLKLTRYLSLRSDYYMLKSKQPRSYLGLQFNIPLDKQGSLSLFYGPSTNIPRGLRHASEFEYQILNTFIEQHEDDPRIADRLFFI